MTENWHLIDPVSERTSAWRWARARGPVREPGPDDPAGTEDETGEP